MRVLLCVTRVRVRARALLCLHVVPEHASKRARACARTHASPHAHVRDTQVGTNAEDPVIDDTVSHLEQVAACVRSGVAAYRNG